jgi:long-chain acyl-CoA synthetase
VATVERETQYPGLAASTVCGAFQLAAAARGGAPALRTRGDQVVYSWDDYAERVRALAAGLAGLGFAHGDTLATMLTNRPEFYFVDMAALHLGMVPFSVYNTSPPEDICHRLANADARIVVTEQAFLPAVREAASRCGFVEHVVVVDEPADGCLTLEDVAAAAGLAGFDFEATWRRVETEDLLTIIYTSGTTGPPKGAQWTHAGAMAQLRNWSRVLPLPRRHISYLPFAHAAERMLGHYMPLGYGATITCCEDYRTVLTDIIEVHPDFVVSVPTLWVKLMTAIRSEIAAVGDDDARARLERTVALGDRRIRLLQAGEDVPDELIAEHEAGLPLLRSTILSKFGLDEVGAAVIGSAPAPPDVLYFFHGAGVPLIEAYGATETTFCATAAPSIEEFRLGTVGPPLPGVEVKIAADDGEILVRGETVMHSYRKQPEETAATIEPDGWLHTGDVGEFDEAGHLKIIGRKKELIINLSGKNMSPANIQAAIKGESSLIAHCVAIGDSRPYVVGLLALDPAELALFASARGIEMASLADAANVPAVADEVAAAVERGNAKLSRVEQIRRYAIVPDEWVLDSEELTPTGKVKRRSVESKYADLVEELYR